MVKFLLSVLYTSTFVFYFSDLSTEQCLFCRFLMTALHMANKEVTLIDKLLLVVVQLPKFPTWLLDIPFADVFLDQFCDSHLEKQELSLVTQASGQEKELVRAFMLHTQCKEALLMWRKNCKDKANYRFTTRIIHVYIYNEYSRKFMGLVLFRSYTWSIIVQNPWCSCLSLLRMLVVTKLTECELVLQK